ncbi:hypothetical protein HB364_16255 [Pseudoflavitalea sp. X16]|uniref:hypothetical protein n=1 Tax=Paraflavitalea devenefica TaxID=2716334 RepID=UPI001422B383|nr:hypothetical protein [Paraflavitalea devenefica]NII26643.1 hypothetical protein [Paraflavitalea devenefica]
MKKSNSGKVYAFPLNFEQGFALCKFMDYTDVASFDGALVYVLNIYMKTIDELPTTEELTKSKVLFGPVPLNKHINVKGKGAWKLVGAIKVSDDPIPVFKDTNQIVSLQKAVDWSTVSGWRKRHFNEGGEECEYEEVRYLEMLELYDMRNVEIRTTMHFLLLNNLKVEDYYNLKDENYKRIYLQMINTSFDRSTAKKYLKVLS